MNKDQKIRVLVAGLETRGNDRGPQLMAAVLRDAGMEVIYAGNDASVSQVVSAAVQEDVSVIGLWVSDKTRTAPVKSMINSLEKENIVDLLYVVGGSLTDKDVSFYKNMGIQMVFTRKKPFDEIIAFILNNVTR